MALNMEGSRTGRAVILSVAGRADGETAPELERVCHQWISPGDRNLILDCSGLQAITSAGLSSVLSAGKEIDRHGGRLLICGLCDHIRRIFMFSGFDSLFPIFDTREAALADCAEKP